MVPCIRLHVSWLTVTFRTHVNISYRIVYHGESTVCAPPSSLLHCTIILLDPGYRHTFRNTGRVRWIKGSKTSVRHTIRYEILKVRSKAGFNNQLIALDDKQKNNERTETKQPSSMDMLQKMINMYDSEAHYLDLKFNMHKSAVSRVGKNFQTCCEKNGCPIDFVRQTKYLGASLLGGKY